MFKVNSENVKIDNEFIGGALNMMKSFEGKSVEWIIEFYILPMVNIDNNNPNIIHTTIYMPKCDLNDENFINTFNNSNDCVTKNISGKSLKSKNCFIPVRDS